MSQAEHRLLSFVDERLESMLQQPSVWGSMESVEDQLIQLLEIRRVLLTPNATSRDKYQLMQAYQAFIMEVVPNATAESFFHSASAC